MYIPCNSTTLHHITLQYIAITFHYVPSHYIPLHSITFHQNPLYSRRSRYFTLHSTTFHYISLHSTTYHYISLHVATFCVFPFVQHLTFTCTLNGDDGDDVRSQRLHQVTGTCRFLILIFTCGHIWRHPQGLFSWCIQSSNYDISMIPPPFILVSLVVNQLCQIQLTFRGSPCCNAGKSWHNALLLDASCLSSGSEVNTALSAS